MSRFIVALVARASISVRSSTAIRAGSASRRSIRGMMTALLLNGYASGIYSSRRIAKACVERADFMMIVALDPPISARSRTSASGT